MRDEQTGELGFRPLGEPTAEQVTSVAQHTFERVKTILHRASRSLLDEHGAADDDDSFGVEQPVLAACYGASVRGHDLLGNRPGQSTLRLVETQVDDQRRQMEPVGKVHGFDVHAKVAVDGRDRKQLERICRYIARPPIAQDRLSRLPDGRLRYTMKNPWSDGTTAVVFEPLDFIARLVALIPPPRFHMLRFVGILAPHCLLRNKVVPKPISVTPQRPVQLSLFGPGKELHTVAGKPLDQPVTVGRRRWAWLLRHVFGADVTVCPACQGSMNISEVATTVAAIDRILGRYGLSKLARGPPPTTGSAQLSLRLPRPIVR